MSAGEVNAGKCLAPVPALGETTVRMGDLHLGPGKSEMKKKGALTTAETLTDIIEKRREIDDKRRQRPFCVLPRQKRRGAIWVGHSGSPWGTRRGGIPKVKKYDRRVHMFIPSLYFAALKDSEYEDSAEDAAGGNPKEEEEEESSQMSD